MANVNIIKNLKGINFVDSLMPVIIQASDPYETAGNFAEYALDVRGFNSNGMKFTLSWSNKSVEFTFRDVIVVSNSTNLYSSQLVSQLQINSFPDIVYSEYAHGIMNHNYLLTHDFFISVDLNTELIVFKAKNKGDEYNLSIENNTSNAQLSTIIIGENSELKENYKILLESYLLDQNKNLIEKLSEDRLPVDKNNLAKFNVSEIIRKHIKYEFNFPPSPLVHLSEPKHIELKYGEFYSDNVPYLYDGGIHKLIPGGLSKNILDKIETYSDIDEYFNVRKDFLTNSPLIKYVSQNQPEYLLFLNTGNSQNINLCYEIEQNGSVNSYTEAVICNKYSIIDIHVYPKYFMQLYGNSIKSITVWIQSDTGLQLTNKRKYTILKDKFRSEFYFLFVNSMGGIDTIRFSDAFIKKTEVEREEFYIADENSDFKSFYQDISFEKQMLFTINRTSEHTNNSIHFTEFFNEFLLSKEIRMISGNNLIEMVLNTKSFVSKTTKQGDYTIEIEAKPSFIDINDKSQVAQHNAFSNKFNNYFKK